MLTGLAWRRHLILDVKSRHRRYSRACGAVSKTRPGEQVRLTLPPRHGTREAAAAGLIPFCP